jgi:diacylglycerol kinase family enzyme
MHLLLNTYAGGGGAKKKWGQIESAVQKNINEVKIINLDNSVDMSKVIQEAEKNDDKDFIIAGGDGTINLFINDLINSTNAQKIKKYRIGAIGIGSSNDFHKPVRSENLLNGIPTKIDFNSCEQRDVCMIKYKVGSDFFHKYFVLNASIGVTADANNLFNNPDAVLKFLKKHFTGLAILYAVLRTILSYRNFEAKIIFDFYETYSFKISNLSIIKNPNISGDLSYPGEVNYQNGLYDIYLTHSMNKLDLINLLKSLSKKVFPKNEKTKYCKTSKLKVTSKNKFLIEYDGETISTNYAEFSILNKYLNICTS